MKFKKWKFLSLRHWQTHLLVIPLKGVTPSAGDVICVSVLAVFLAIWEWGQWDLAIGYDIQQSKVAVVWKPPLWPF